MARISGLFTRGFAGSLVIEFGPTVAFFIFSQLYGFLAGAVALVASTAFSLVWSLIRDKRIAFFSLVTSSFVLFFGIMTIIMNTPVWLFAEYTLYNAIFGIMLLIGCAFRKGLLKQFFGTLFHITEHGWFVLSLRWSAVFIITAVANEIAWRVYGWDFWVTFRFFASVLQAIFGFSQLFLARRERLQHASEWGLRR